jgi:hypothetical protein
MPPGRAERAVLAVAVLLLATTPASAQARDVNVRALAGPKHVLSRDNVRPVAADVANIRIRPDQYVLARWAAEDLPTTPVRSPDAKAWAVGFGFIGVTAEGQEVRFRPIVETSGGLGYAQDADGFQGQIFVGLVDLKNPAAAYQLPQPVTLLLTGQVDSVAPRQLEIAHTNLPFIEVTLGARDPRDQLELQVLASGTPERARVLIPVIRPRLELAASRQTIGGFGIETADVSVRAVGVSRPAGRVVTLSSDRGDVEPARVTLDEQGTGSARLRSVSVGTAMIEASSPPLAPASAPVQFAWPIAVLVAAIAGGMIGAYLGRVQRSRIRSVRALRSVVLAGLLTGIVVVALYAVGVNVLPIQPTATAGEALAFSLAAVGGYVGLRVPQASSAGGRSS